MKTSTMRTVCSLPDFGLKQRLKTMNKKKRRNFATTLRIRLDTVPTHNKYIFVRLKKVWLLREKCLFGEKVFIFGSEGFRILG